MEKATSEEIFNDKELLNLYKKFQFDIDQLLNAKKEYKLLHGYEGRALLYQRLLLTEDIDNKLSLSLKLKNSFDNEIYQKHLMRIVLYIKKIVKEIPLNYSTFYSENKEFKKIKNLKLI